MRRIYAGWLFVFGALIGVFAMLGNDAVANGPPSNSSAGAYGAIGTFTYVPPGGSKGRSTWWVDTDGFDPGTPGCHIETNAEGKPFPGSRVFPEACKSRHILVESNPERQKVHEHKGDVGHPDMVDCRDWCRVAEGTTSGMCVKAAAPSPCRKGGFPLSAKCVCDND